MRGRVLFSPTRGTFKGETKTQEREDQERDESENMREREREGLLCLRFPVCSLQHGEDEFGTGSLLTVELRRSLLLCGGQCRMSKSKFTSSLKGKSILKGTNT